jgi:iduronate 2-sulfatase
MSFYGFSRKSFQIAVITAWWGLVVCAGRAPAETPSVLFIMADDLRCDVGCMGGPALTPHIDRLAARGVLFERAYCQQALCNPSRSSLLTGLRPDTLGLWCNSVHFRELKPDAVTLPRWFKEHGYATRCVGKIFHNWHTAVHGDRQSWSADEFLHYATHGDDAPQAADPPPSTAIVQRRYGKGPLTECRDVADEAYYDGRVAAEAARVLGDLESGPFFLAVGFWKPHAPFNAPKKYWDLYERDRLPPVEATRPAHAPAIAFHESTEILGPPDRQAPLSPEEIAELRHGYLAGISYLDAQVGRVLDALERTGRASDTIVVFVSDHGFHLGEHGLWAKTSNFELDAHVPLLIADPRIGHGGRKTRGIVELVDIFPTLVDACGLPAPPGLEGTCLMPIVRGQPKAAGEAAFTQHPRPAYFDRGAVKQPEAMGYSIRTDRVRYTEWRDYATGTVIARELYDHTADAAELRNAIDDPRLAPSRREAERRLHGQFPSTVGGPSLQSQGFKTED